ncbi:helix-turn-helix transcriptional regulator [Streptomyces sp. ISL-100]|nr:helix-turn-helix transcriptional regulator [Streptomyces sp. ISL-100]
MANPEPPMAWRYCGNQIKRWRERAGVTREALAKEASCSYGYVKAIEAGRRKPTLHLPQVADGYCGARRVQLCSVRSCRAVPGGWAGGAQGAAVAPAGGRRAPSCLNPGAAVQRGRKPSRRTAAPREATA